MALPQQTWQALGNYGGVTFAQDSEPTGTSDLRTDDFFYQEFYLPSNYERGEGIQARRPDITGFQFLANVQAGVEPYASCEYVMDVYVVGEGWLSLAAGIEIGCHSDGTKVWYDVHLDTPLIVLPERLTQRFRIGIKGRTITDPTFGEVVVYDSAQGVATIGAERINVRLIPYKPTAVVVKGKPGFLVYDPESKLATFSHQFGLQAVWYTSPNPLGTHGSMSEVDDASMCFRLLSQSADEGADFLGNRYRSVVVKAAAESVSTVDGVTQDKFWLSKPNPSKLAVECLYFDVRDADGKATVVDSILVDPLTPGVWFNAYYSTEGAPGQTEDEWEDKLWTHVRKSFRMTRRERHVLPEPIIAKYICIEFSHLQAQVYSPGPFVQAIRYKKFPKWVLDYFLLTVSAENNSYDPLVAKSVSVKFDLLDFAYNYYQDDLRAQPLYPGDEATQTESIASFLAERNDISDKVDSQTLAQIKTSLDQFASHPGNFTDPGSLLGQYVASLANNRYPVEIQTINTTADTRTVSSTDRTAVMKEQEWPVMFFYVTARHRYREVQASFEKDRGYFVGVKELAFTRDQYAVEHDQELYIESTGDDVNVWVNDFVQIENTWAVYDPNGVPPTADS
jgi:hypothetical protein